VLNGEPYVGNQARAEHGAKGVLCPKLPATTIRIIKLKVKLRE
jgi:hypothetical protein